MDELLKRAEELAGRPVELEQTQDKKWVVLYMTFERSPPPKGETQEEALRLFIEMMLKRGPEASNLPSTDDTKENT